MKNNQAFYNAFAGIIISSIEIGNKKQQEPPYNDFIEFSPVFLTDDYAKKWNERSKDFFKIYHTSGHPVSETLYRQGGMFNRKHLNYPYFQIIKHREAFYDKKTFPLHTLEQSRHLESVWVIIDSKTGEEVYEFSRFDHGHIYDNSILCLYKNEIFNIKTKEVLAKSIYSGSTVESDEYLFVQSNFNDDKEKIGVFKIHKLTGEIEFFKGKTR